MLIIYHSNITTYLKISFITNAMCGLSFRDLIPDVYFADFLRGHLDGDGYKTTYWDKRWKNSYMLYIGFVSASKIHLEWIKGKISALFQVEGKIKYAGKSVYQLVYAKYASIKLLQILYYSSGNVCLSRKRFKIECSFAIISLSRDAEMVDRHA